MKEKILFVLGFIWAFPITLLAFVFYVLPCWLLGYYKYVGFMDKGFVWFTTPSMPKILADRWDGWAGHALGNVVVIHHNYEKKPELFNVILTHEMEHVRQCMRLGLLQPLVYFVIFVAGSLIGNVSPYYDNIFEIGARRAAGQTIDVVGLKKRLAALPKLKK